MDDGWLSPIVSEKSSTCHGSVYLGGGDSKEAIKYFNHNLHFLPLHIR